MKPTFFGRLRAATCNFTGLAAALLLVLSVFFAPSASAHDVLVGSDPDDGAEVESLTSFTLTFNNDPLDVNPIIMISGPDGQEKALDVTPVVDGRDVYVEFSDLEPGEYAVSWRVVSSDGHPIEGDQTFTILPSSDTDEPAAEEPATDPDEPAADPDESVNSEDDAEDTDAESATDDAAEAPADASADADADDDDGSNSSAWMLWLALGLGVAVALGLFGKKSTNKKTENTNENPPS